MKSPQKVRKAGQELEMAGDVQVEGVGLVDNSKCTECNTVKKRRQERGDVR